MENVGQHKCTECGLWYYNIDWNAPDLDPSGTPIFSGRLDKRGRPTMSYRNQYIPQNIHNCRGASSATKANRFETKLSDDREKLRQTRESVDEDSRINQRHIQGIATELVQIRSRLDKVDDKLDKLVMDVETALRPEVKNFFKPANELEMIDRQAEQKDLVEEIANTDDQTELESHSINYVNDDERQQPAVEGR